MSDSLNLPLSSGGPALNEESVGVVRTRIRKPWKEKRPHGETLITAGDHGSASGAAGELSGDTGGGRDKDLREVKRVRRSSHDDTAGGDDVHEIGAGHADASAPGRRASSAERAASPDPSEALSRLSMQDAEQDTVDPDIHPVMLAVIENLQGLYDELPSLIPNEEVRECFVAHCLNFGDWIPVDQGDAGGPTVRYQSANYVRRRGRRGFMLDMPRVSVFQQPLQMTKSQDALKCRAETDISGEYHVAGG